MFKNDQIYKYYNSLNSGHLFNIYWFLFSRTIKNKNIFLTLNRSITNYVNIIIYYGCSEIKLI